MPINFDRRLTQDYFVNILDQKRRIEPKYKFDQYVLQQADVDALKTLMPKDAVGLYYNAVVSYLHGLNSLKNESISWGCVELYYSMFYVLRSLMCFDRYLLIRDKGLYLLKVAVNETGHKKDSKDFNTDHGGTINHYAALYKDSDFLLSNNVDDFTYYKWITEVREITNYREQHFQEPFALSSFSNTVANLQDRNINELLETIMNDWGLYCFDLDYAIISGPLFKILECHNKYHALVDDVKFSMEQRAFISGCCIDLGLSNNLTMMFI